MGLLACLTSDIKKEGVLIHPPHNCNISFDGETKGTVLKDEINHNDFVGLNKKF